MRNCGTRIYESIDRSRVDAILKGLIDHGSVVTGSNPWDVDTRDHGVRLRGEWNEEASKLAITITDADWHVPEKSVWKSIEPLMLLARAGSE